MTNITIRPACAADITRIALRLRADDRREIEASSHLSIIESIADSLERSSLAMTVTLNDEPEMMFGAADLSILSSTGCPWLIGTDRITRHPTAFYRRSLFWRDALLERYEILRNAVDERNLMSIRWLWRLGFTLYEPTPIGLNGEMFRIFEMRR